MINLFSLLLGRRIHQTSSILPPQRFTKTLFLLLLCIPPHKKSNSTASRSRKNKSNGSGELANKCIIFDSADVLIPVILPGSELCFLQGCKNGLNFFYICFIVYYIDWSLFVGNLIPKTLKMPGYQQKFIFLENCIEELLLLPILITFVLSLFVFKQDISADL